MRLLTLVCLLCSTSLAQAGPDRILFQLGSKHFNMDESSSLGGFEEINPGITLTWENRLYDLNYSVGAFRNSYGKLAPVVGVSKFWNVAPDVDLGLFGGLSYYGDEADFISVNLADSGVIPLAGVQANYKNLYLQLIPTDDQAPGFGFLAVTGITFGLGGR